MMVNVPLLLISGSTPMARYIATLSRRAPPRWSWRLAAAAALGGQGRSHAKQAALLQQVAAIESAFPPRRFSGEQTGEHNVFLTG